MLAVFTTQLGATFINRHVLCIAPGQTVAVSKMSSLAPDGFWTSNLPVFYVDAFMRRIGVRLMRRCGILAERQCERALGRFLERNGVRVALGEFLDEFTVYVPLLERLGIPYVVQSHGMDASAKLRIPEIASRYLLYRNARAVLTRSRLHQQRLIDLGLPAAKVHVSIGGVDVPEAIPQRGPEASNRFLAIGYMTAKKSPIYVLEAFRRAAAEDPAISLDYVGHGPLYAAAKHYVAAGDLAARVRLHGFASEATKQRLLGECGVFVQHSVTDSETGDEEGVPASIQEALAHGMAVVSTRHSGIPDIIAEGVNGLLVDEGDVKGMARSMLEIIPHAPVIGVANHAAALTRHAWRFERERLVAALGL